MTDIYYKRIAYIEIAIYSIIAIYFIQKFLIKYYVEDINNNKLENSKTVGSIIATGIAGGSALSTFNNLVIDRFKSLFSFISSIFDSIFGSINNLIGGQIKTLNDIRNYMKPIRDYITNATSFFYKSIEKFTITIMYTFHRLRQIMNRSLSSFNLIFHTLENTRNTILSIANSQPLKYIFNTASRINWIFSKMSKLCFDGKVPLKLKDGSTKYIKDIQCGDVLHDNSIVTSTLYFLNDEPLYSIHSNELDIDILVSGSHIIYDTKYKIWKTVKNYGFANKTDYIPTKLYCISTSTHLINIGEIMFSDYEEISNKNDITYQLNNYILSGLNNHITSIDNNYFNKETKHMDSGLYKGTLIRMNDNTWKKIEDIIIGDLLYNKIEVIGCVKILANDHKWFKLDDLICTDATKIYDDKLQLWHSINTYDNIKEYNIENDDIKYGYQLILFSFKEQSLQVYSCNKIYKIVDFIQIHDNKIQEMIEKVGIINMNKLLKN